MMIAGYDATRYTPRKHGTGNTAEPNLFGIDTMKKLIVLLALCVLAAGLLVVGCRPEDRNWREQPPSESKRQPPAMQQQRNGVEREEREMSWEEKRTQEQRERNKREREADDAFARKVEEDIQAINEDRRQRNARRGAAGEPK